MDSPNVPIAASEGPVVPPVPPVAEADASGARAAFLRTFLHTTLGSPLQAQPFLRRPLPRLLPTGAS